MVNVVKRTVFRAYLKQQQFVQGLRGRSVVHFLHIGKTGGTAIKEALKAASRQGRHVVMLHPHGVVMADIPRGDKIVFCLRDPVSRFVSGFYSRQRQGLPRYLSPWSEAEAAAFGRFSSASALGEALSSPDPALHDAAVAAMQGIAHVRDPYLHWFGDEQAFLARKDDILFVGFQETLDQDFARLAGLLGLADTTLPQDEASAHRNPDSVDKRLSDEAVVNLRRWYARDYAFIDLCRQHFRAPAP